ncbi:peptidoglycan-binding protein [Chloroflexia bacterium SDU3-3]|nr:peptidoglycan-binding protein [Chloroflexia bacterium SDU3-3]
MRLFHTRTLALPMIACVLVSCATATPQPPQPTAAAAQPTAAAAQPTAAPAALGATVAPAPTDGAGLGATVAPRPTSMPPAASDATAPTRTRNLLLQNPMLEGEDVRALQDRLTKLGYAHVGTVDGVFGGQTELAVKAFQALNSLEVDGVVGPQTWERLFAQQAVAYDMHAVVDISRKIVIGLVNNGSWVKAEVGAPYLLPATYISLGQGSGPLRFAGSAAKPKDDPICTWLYSVEVTDGQSPSERFALGADWQPMPRPVTEVPVTTASLVPPVEAALQKLGLSQPKVQITRAIQADIDGDGTSETAVAATKYGEGTAPSSSAQPGDYSILVIIHADATKPATVVASDVITKPIEFGAPQVFSLNGLWDLNGDGRLEILADSDYYEGDSSVVYDLPPAGPSEALSQGCGV